MMLMMANLVITVTAEIIGRLCGLGLILISHYYVEIGIGTETETETEMKIWIVIEIGIVMIVVMISVIQDQDYQLHFVSASILALEKLITQTKLAQNYYYCYYYQTL